MRVKSVLLSLRMKSVLLSLVLALAGVFALTTPAWAHPVLHISASPTTVNAGSNTTLTISGTSNGNYSGARIDVFSSGGPGTLPSFTSFVSCGAGPTRSEVGSVYRLALPNLTNGQAFSYTITLKIDAATAATSFTSKAQFYKSDNTTDGPTTGPVITVTNPTADLLTYEYSNNAGQADYVLFVQNNGPATVPAATVTTTVDRTGFGTPIPDAAFDDFTCTFSGQSSTCTSTVPPLAPGDSAYLHLGYNLNLLALGTYVITNTVSSSFTDPNPANNTLTATCNVLTSLVASCTYA